jgi:DNA-binding response OmpR family regulator
MARSARSKALENGADVLTKPLEFATLRSDIEAWLGKGA